MKTATKILAVILSLALGVMMFAIGASAAPGGTITLNNTMTSVSINGRTFNAYRIFDVTTDGAGHYAYTFANASVQAYFAAKSPSITTGADAVAYIEALDNNAKDVEGKVDRVSVQTDSKDSSKRTVSVHIGDAVVDINNIREIVET